MRAQPPSEPDCSTDLEHKAETEAETTLTDPKPQKRRGRPPLPRDENGNIIRVVVAQRLTRFRDPSKRKAAPLTAARTMVGCDLPRADLDRLDAYRDAHEHESRAQAARELIAGGLDRWERLQSRPPPAAVPAPLRGIWARLRLAVRLAWAVLCTGTVPARP